MRAAALILCTAALAAGCGDDDEETAVETTTVTTTETVTTTPPEPAETTPEEPDDGGSGGAEAPPAEGHGGAEATLSKCGRVAFNPSTDSGASEITAVGTDCQTAVAVARAARNAIDELTYVAEDFTCTGARSNKAGLSSIEWFCVGADREVVTFATT